MQDETIQVEADARRTAAMERPGWCVLRISVNHVAENPEGAWAKIEPVISRRPLS